MDRDLVRQISNVVAYVVTLVANGMAVALPLNGNTTAELSDRFPVLVTPSNYVFTIWTLIYLLLGAFAIYQALPRMRRDPDLRAIGYLPVLAGALNTLWIFLWHFEVFAATVPVMLALLVTLSVIHVRLRGVRSGTGAKRWLLGLPFSVYLGWITVATIANISQMLYWAGFRGGPLSEDAWAVIVLATGTIIAAVMLLRESDWAYALVIVWAFVGIAAKQTAAAAVWGAALGAIVVLVLIAWVMYRRQPSVPCVGPAVRLAIAKIRAASGRLSVMPARQAAGDSPDIVEAGTPDAIAPISLPAAAVCSVDECFICDASPEVPNDPDRFLGRLERGQVRGVRDDLDRAVDEQAALRLRLVGRPLGVVGAGDEHGGAADRPQSRSQVRAPQGYRHHRVRERPPLHRAQAVEHQRDRLGIVRAGPGRQQRVADPTGQEAHHADDTVDGQKGSKQEAFGPAVGLDRRPERGQGPAPIRPRRREHDPHVSAPRVTDPVHGLPDVERLEDLARGRRTVIEGVSMPRIGARPVPGTRDDHQSPVAGEVFLDPLPGPLVDEQAVP